MPLDFDKQKSTFSPIEWITAFWRRLDEGLSKLIPNSYDRNMILFIVATAVGCIIFFSWLACWSEINSWRYDELARNVQGLQTDSEAYQLIEQALEDDEVCECEYSDIQQALHIHYVKEGLIH